MVDELELSPKHKDGFDRIYDLPDPAPYFAALRGADYRMPDELTGLLRQIRPQLGEAKSSSGSVRVLDFGCGYGTNGALLRHRLRMSDLYAHYGRRSWQLGDGNQYWQEDVDYFRTKRLADESFELAGVDIAGSALEYARHLGFIDHGFPENLALDEPSPALRRFLTGIDLIIESGAIGGIAHSVFERILDAAGAGRRPWFIYCPRPDVDWTDLEHLWRQRGYTAQPCRRRPVHYRKPLSDDERRDVLRLARGFGKSDEETLHQDYLLVDLMLARHHSERLAPPIESIVDPHD